MLTALRTRLAAARAASDAGITLVELVVAMALSTIIAAMTLTLFVNVNDSTQSSTDRAIDSAEARNVLQAWTSYLRVADGPTYGNPAHRFEWITPNDMLFYADLGNRRSGVDSVATPTVVWLRLTAGRLIEELFDYGATTPRACRILADQVTSTALFTASDSGFAPMTADDLGQPMATGGAGCTTLPAAIAQTDMNAVVALQDVGRIEINFALSDTRNRRTIPFTSVADVPTLLGGTP